MCVCVCVCAVSVDSACSLFLPEKDRLLDQRLSKKSCHCCRNTDLDRSEEVSSCFEGFKECDLLSSVTKAYVVSNLCDFLL